MKIKRKMIALLCAAAVSASAVPSAFAAERDLTPDSGAEKTGEFISVDEPSGTAGGLLGDANHDGAVDIADATAIHRIIAKMTKPDDAALRLADVDGDGEVTVIDATFVQRYLAAMPCPDGIGKPIEEEIEHKLISSVKSYRRDFDTDEWELTNTTAFEYENAYPVVIDSLDNYEDAEHVQKTIEYTFDSDQPLTRTLTSQNDNTVTTAEYNNGRIYNLKNEYSGGAYDTEMYQYGHDDEYFTLVLHQGYIPGNEYAPPERKEEADSVSVTTENGLLKRTTNTGIYAKWVEGKEKKWVRFRGVYTIDYDEYGIVNLMSAVYSDIGFRLMEKFEVVKKNGVITEVIQYQYNDEWVPFTKFELTYNDTEISPARYSQMINDIVAHHGGNYYIFNWY